MMKRALGLLMGLLLCASAAQATILPASGVDEDFKAWTGIACTPAVVLCQSLTVYDERGDQGGQKVEILFYSGETIPVIESWDGYAKIYYADGAKTGWVHNEYLLFDPAWYVCDEGMPVYAYPDAMSPRVGWLAAGTKLPILTEYDDGKSVADWVCVSLRGAAGWIRKTPADTVGGTWFRPEQLTDMHSAVLTYQGRSIAAAGSADMEALSALLTSVRDLGAEMAGCSFDATLTLYLADGTSVTLAVATDSCCVYRVDGRDYQYARGLVTEEGNPDNSVLLAVFGVNTWSELLLPGNG